MVILWGRVLFMSGATLYLQGEILDSLERRLLHVHLSREAGYA